MPKVRWSQRCAGPCGRWMRHGARAVRAHSNLWCAECWREHRNICTRCQDQVTDRYVTTHDGDLVLF